MQERRHRPLHHRLPLPRLRVAGEERGAPSKRKRPKVAVSSEEWESLSPEEQLRASSSLDPDTWRNARAHPTPRAGSGAMAEDAVSPRAGDPGPGQRSGARGLRARRRNRRCRRAATIELTSASDEEAETARRAGRPATSLRQGEGAPGPRRGTTAAIARARSWRRTRCRFAPASGVELGRRGRRRWTELLADARAPARQRRTGRPCRPRGTAPAHARRPDAGSENLPSKERRQRRRREPDWTKAIDARSAPSATRTRSSYTEDALRLEPRNERAARPARHRLPRPA